MMKKIKYIRDLEEEKMRLRIRQLELEKEIRTGWIELKEDFTPVAFLKNKLSGISSQEIKEKGLLSSALSHGAAHITRQFLNETGEKIETQVQHEVEKAIDKIKTVFEKK